LQDQQVIDLTVEPAVGYQRLWSGLKTAGLDPARQVWDGSRPPYPGLMAFQEQDAAVYFGREKDVQATLELLKRLQRRGGPQFALVLGASGSGKSSLVRAGVIPKLRRDKDRWLVLDPLRPLGRPFAGLAEVLTHTLHRGGDSQDWQSVRDALRASANNMAPAALLPMIYDLREVTGQREATVLLIIDQFEELLERGDDTANRFLHMLRTVLEDKNSPLLVLGTLRSDFFGTFQTHPAVSNLSPDDALLSLLPIPISDVAQVIEGPAQVAGLELEPGLVQALVTDTKTDDALPLLAFTLRELWERDGQDGRLTLETYRNRLGGLQGSVAKVAEDVCHNLPPAQEADLRKAFLAMVRVNEDGQYVRKPARWAELPEAVHSLLERFVHERLLVSRDARVPSSGASPELILEVAHEALFRSWKRLVAWLQSDREFLLWRQRLHGAVTEWKATNRDKNTLLRGPLLTEAERWLKYSRTLTDEECDFIRQSAKARMRRKTMAAGIVMLVLLSIGFVSWYRNNQLSPHMLVWLLYAPFGYTPEPQMVDVPAGSFLMGSPESDGKAQAAEKPQHRVTVHKPFRISKFEVTFDEYDFFVHLTSRRLLFVHPTSRRLSDPNGWGRGRQPVINVTWDDAQAYVAWLRERTGRLYRLPTEAEWEYAARAGTTTRYWWGDEVPTSRQANCADCGNEWSNKQTAPVGAFLANPWGLHDTAGNVGEWVQDCFHENYQDAPSESGSAWKDANGKCLMRILRGGSWNNGAWFSRSAFRIWFVPDYQSASIGFRLAQDLD
jgi:formylglycine-generating enzyme required for sulfatase activity